MFAWVLVKTNRAHENLVRFGFRLTFDGFWSAIPIPMRTAEARVGAVLGFLGLYWEEFGAREQFVIV